MKIKCELYNDNFQNRKKYNIPRAQLVIADIPYNLGNNAFASNPSWYVGGDNKNGESKKAGKQFFPSDKNFNLVEYMHFCSKLLKPEPKERGKAPAMIMFCSFEQMAPLIEVAKRYGFKNSYPLFFIKKSSPQALKAKSHSTRVRGLKFFLCIKEVRHAFVALYTSAWIEIPPVRSEKPCDSVALYTSAWIEINSATKDIVLPERRTLHECVD